MRDVSVGEDARKESRSLAALGMTRGDYALGMTRGDYALGMTRGDYALGMTRGDYALGMARGVRLRSRWLTSRHFTTSTGSETSTVLGVRHMRSLQA